MQREGSERPVGQEDVTGFADLPADLDADRQIWKALELKALDPNRRRLFLDVFFKTPNGRQLFAGLLFDLGFFNPTLPTNRAVAMRDVAAHLLFSTGLAINEQLVMAWMERMGDDLVFLNNRDIDAQRRQAAAAHTNFDPNEGNGIGDDF